MSYLCPIRTKHPIAVRRQAPSLPPQRDLLAERLARSQCLRNQRTGHLHGTTLLSSGILPRTQLSSGISVSPSIHDLVVNVNVIHDVGRPSTIRTLYSWFSGSAWLALRTSTSPSNNENSNASYWARFRTRFVGSSLASRGSDMVFFEAPR